jgi:hypothetical protein
MSSSKKVLDEKLCLSGQLKFRYRRVLNLLLSSKQSHISRQRSRIPSAYHNTYMKANLRDKEPLPLSRATWSVLHDRHYFHHHRHRPHNRNVHLGERGYSVQHKHLNLTGECFSPNVSSLVKSSDVRQPRILLKDNLHRQTVVACGRRSLKLRRPNTIQCNNQFSTLNKASRSSNDPGENKTPRFLHLQPSSVSELEQSSCLDASTPRKTRYMYGKTSVPNWRDKSKDHTNSELFMQVVSRCGRIKIPNARTLEVA